MIDKYGRSNDRSSASKPKQI